MLSKIKKSETTESITKILTEGSETDFENIKEKYYIINRHAAFQTVLNQIVDQWIEGESSIEIAKIYGIKDS